MKTPKIIILHSHSRIFHKSALMKAIKTMADYVSLQNIVSRFTSLPACMRSSFSGKLFSLMTMGIAIPFFASGTLEKKPANSLQNTQWSRNYLDSEGYETDAYIQFTTDSLFVWEKRKDCACYELNVIRYKTENGKFYYWRSEISGWTSDEIFIHENGSLIFYPEEIPVEKTIFTKDVFNAAGWCICK